MPPPSAAELRSPDAASVARFRRDLGELIDVDRHPLLVAVSGGPDSIALLLLAHAVLGERCFAATVDHGLRPHSAGEARLVAGLCAARGIAHEVLSGPLPERVDRTANISVRARALRYQLLRDHAGEVGFVPTATAHHADDQLETLVMRLNRGAGVAGLAGIRSGAPHGHILRPLLRWRRAELARIVAGCGITPVDDPTNRDDRYDRARLRKALVGADWLDVDRIGTSVAALGEAEDALDWAARRAFREHCVADGDRLVLDPGLPAEILRRVVIRCVEQVDGRCDPTGPAVTRLIAALHRGRPAMLGDVAVTVSAPFTVTTRWHFRPAPPRRSH